jgi:methylglutaconyl-CoA hydratase
MTEELVRYESRPPAVIITLNRPDKRNALSRALIQALTDAVHRAKVDPEARSVILTGAGPAFCAGMDLSELAEILQQPSESAVWEDALCLARLDDLIYTLPKPTIAAVNGAAVAGGAGLVTVCDLGLAVPGAVFGYTEVRRGLVAAMVMPHLLRHVGERSARQLLLTGDLIDANEACRIGLINQVVPPEKLLDQGLKLAESLADGGPKALAMTKSLLQRFSPQAMSIEETAKASAAPRLSDECQQGLQAFFAKQPNPWNPPRASHG